MKNLLALVTFLLALPLANASDSGAWPTKPITLIVPFSAGSLTDIIARAYGVELAQRLKVPVVVVNKAGAAGLVGTQLLLKDAADGYTIMIQGSNFAIMPSVKKLAFDLKKDLAGIALVQKAATLAVVSAKSPYKSFGDLVAKAKESPGGLSYGSAGMGSASHLTGEYYLSAGDIKMNHIPYKGAQEPFIDIEGGRLNATFPPLSLPMAMINSGKLRALAISGEKRSPLLPEVPTMAELGYNDFRLELWYVFLAKRGTPKPILERLASELRAISDVPRVAENMKGQGLERTHIELGALDGYLSQQIEHFGRIAQHAGISAD